VLAVVSTCFGLALLAEGGIADADGLNGLVLSAPLVGIILGGVAGARLGRTREGRTPSRT